VRSAIRILPESRLESYLVEFPNASVHDVCRDLLGGLDVKAYGGTRRAYAAVYDRLLRAKRALGLAPPLRRQGSPTVNARIER
jgi:hypothetical protein